MKQVISVHGTLMHQGDHALKGTETLEASDAQRIVGTVPAITKTKASNSKEVE